MPEHEAITSPADLHLSLAPLIDANGNELLKGIATGSAVNEFSIRNAATGSSPSIEATGDDTNLDIKLVPKGTGLVKVGTVGVALLSGAQTLADKTLATPTITGAINFPDNTRQIFNPGANASGLNVGQIAGDPDTPVNGDLWYDSTAHQLTARINGANVALGAGGGGGGLEYTSGGTSGAFPYFDGTGFLDSVLSYNGTDLLVSAGDLQLPQVNGQEFRFGSSNVMAIRHNTVTSMQFLVYGAVMMTLSNTGLTMASKLTMGSQKFILGTIPPASSSAAGTAGEITWDSTYFYGCVATNSWKRIAWTTF